MKRLLVSAMALAMGAIPATAQSLEDLNIQIHGYATQGFLYSTNNNFFTTTSSNGSPAWTEAVINVGAQPIPKLRVSVQARYFLLGNFGNAITLDFASADYKVNDQFGVRFGKVKTPSGLFNEIQDIDPGYIWSLLPQSIYPLSSRNSNLAHEGGVVYGTLKLGQNLGKVEYRGWGGERVLDSNDGYLSTSGNGNSSFPSGMNWAMYGGALHWRTPLTGLMVGASGIKNLQNKAPFNETIPSYGTFSATLAGNPTIQPNYFAEYSKGKVMLAGETSREIVTGKITIPALSVTSPYRQDDRRWYAMASYKLTDKLTAGVYDTQYVDHQAAFGPSRYTKDWAISGRYDFNQFLYAKAEQHIVDGTHLGYDTVFNPGGLKPTSKLTILKVGVSF
jgi:hypothetical protein